MRIVITGGLGMLGTELARRLRATRPQDELLLLDMPAALAAPDDLADVEVLRGDIRDEALLREALDSPEVAIVHLASVVSAGAERDFDAALEVNVDGGRALVQACRAHATTPRLVFTSSLAVFGGELALGPVDDNTRPTPSTTYGATKAMLELLFADATRKGFVDARSARPPTVIVRPGAPNAAASSFASAVVREPLAGRPSTLPVSLDLPTVVIGVDTTVGCLARLLEIDGDALGSGRALNLPGLVATPGELLAAVHALVDPATLAPLTVTVDPVVETMVRSWPVDWSSTRADALGLPRDEDAAGIVRAYLQRIGR
jgi:nucleoside-diphosphate-sugar epimerase